MDGSQTLQKLGKIEHSHPLRETVFSNDLIEQFTIRNPGGEGNKGEEEWEREEGNKGEEEQERGEGNKGEEEQERGEGDKGEEERERGERGGVRGKGKGGRVATGSIALTVRSLCAILCPSQRPPGVPVCGVISQPRS